MRSRGAVSVRLAAPATAPATIVASVGLRIGDDEGEDSDDDSGEDILNAQKREVQRMSVCVRAPSFYCSFLRGLKCGGARRRRSLSLLIFFFSFLCVLPGPCLDVLPSLFSWVGKQKNFEQDSAALCDAFTHFSNELLLSR